jgi:hypothetical protein
MTSATKARVGLLMTVVGVVISGIVLSHFGRNPREPSGPVDWTGWPSDED